MKIIFPIVSILIFAASVFAQKSPITVYIAGDSTAAAKLPEKRPETGWGEMLQQYFDIKKVKIDNRAMNGRSTRTFISENRWQAITDNLKKAITFLSSSDTTTNRRKRLTATLRPEILSEIWKNSSAKSAPKKRFRFCSRP